jgi:3-isopropylmalate dehydratase small subunit
LFLGKTGKGSIGNLASAAVVAASSFDMKVTNPRSLLDRIDYAHLQKALNTPLENVTPESVVISEPAPFIGKFEGATGSVERQDPVRYEPLIRGKIQRFEDHIDTDAIIPAEFMPGTSDKDLGTHCFQYVRPEFREKVKTGSTIVVAGVGFGSGSSREEAPRALKGVGVKVVIAKSYAYIYGRNQPNMALLGVMIKDSRFYELAQEDVDLELDLPARRVQVKGESFKFELSSMEEAMVMGGGVTQLYKNYGKKLFRAAIEQSTESSKGGCAGGTKSQGTNSSCTTTKSELAW